MTDNRLQ